MVEIVCDSTDSDGVDHWDEERRRCLRVVLVLDPAQGMRFYSQLRLDRC